METSTHMVKIKVEIWGDAFISQETPKIAGKPQVSRRGAQAVSLIAIEGSDPANTLILDFQHPELRQEMLLFFKLSGLWYFVMAVPTT